jgi:deoxyribonuclease V
VTLRGNLSEPKLIGAVDTAYGYGGEKLYASAVVMTFPDLEEVARMSQFCEVTFPYIPGLFYFREGPAIVDALAGLSVDPDVIIVHGHGIAHERSCGLATHVGLEFDIPTIGCSRRLLTGTHRPLGDAKGSSQPIIYRRKEVGKAIRSKEKVKPLYISPGNGCDLNYCVDIVTRCLRGYRLPEPLRLAHLLANKFKRYKEKNLKHV